MYSYIYTFMYYIHIIMNIKIIFACTNSVWIVIFFRVVGKMRRGAFSVCSIIYLTKERLCWDSSLHSYYELSGWNQFSNSALPRAEFIQTVVTSGWWRWHGLTEVDCGIQRSCNDLWWSLNVGNKVVRLTIFY